MRLLLVATFAVGLVFQPAASAVDPIGVAEIAADSPAEFLFSPEVFSLIADVGQFIGPDTFPGNLPPWLPDIEAVAIKVTQTTTTWQVFGQVFDDDFPVPGPVRIEFRGEAGVVEGHYVFRDYATGEWSFTFELPSGLSSAVTAQAVDQLGARSDIKAVGLIFLSGS